MSETRTAVGSKLYPRGSMVFWTDDPKPYWVIEWQPDNGSGAYWIVNAEGETAVATEDELFQFPQEPTQDWREVWWSLSSPVYRVLNEEGENIANSQIRQLDAERFLCVDDEDGFTVLPASEAIHLIREKVCNATPTA